MLRYFEVCPFHLTYVWPQPQQSLPRFQNWAPTSGALTAALLQLLPYKLPISEIFKAAAKSVSCQRPWVDMRPGRVKNGFLLHVTKGSFSYLGSLCFSNTILGVVGGYRNFKCRGCAAQNLGVIWLIDCGLFVVYCWLLLLVAACCLLLVAACCTACCLLLVAAAAAACCYSHWLLLLLVVVATAAAAAAARCCSLLLVAARCCYCCCHCWLLAAGCCCCCSFAVAGAGATFLLCCCCFAAGCLLLLRIFQPLPFVHHRRLKFLTKPTWLFLNSSTLRPGTREPILGRGSKSQNKPHQHRVQEWAAG